MKSDVLKDLFWGCHRPVCQHSAARATGLCRYASGLAQLDRLCLVRLRRLRSALLPNKLGIGLSPPEA